MLDNYYDFYDFEEYQDVISIITKGKFGKEIINSLALPKELDSLDFKLNILHLETKEWEDLSANEIVFVVADVLIEEEWIKICQARPKFVVAIGCCIPKEIKLDGCSIYETQVEACAKTILAIMFSVSYNFFRWEWEQMRDVLLQQEKQTKAIYIESMEVAELAKLTLKKLADEKIPLTKIKVAICSYFYKDGLYYNDVFDISETLHNEMNPDIQFCHSVILPTFDSNYEENNKIGLNVIVFY